MPARRADAKSESAVQGMQREGSGSAADDTALDSHAQAFRQIMQRDGQGDSGSSGGGSGDGDGGQPRGSGQRKQARAPAINLTPAADPASAADPKPVADAAPSALPISPSGVFGAQMSGAQMPAVQAAPAPPREPDTASLGQRIGEAVERLMVGDGRSGNRQVRMDLKDDLLEGVSVTVQEMNGRLQVDFACAVESSRLRLNSAAPGQAHELATRLARDVLLRIHTGDESDQHLLEVVAHP